MNGGETGSISLSSPLGEEDKTSCVPLTKINQLVLNLRESRRTFATLESFFFFSSLSPIDCPRVLAAQIVQPALLAPENWKKKQNIKNSKKFIKTSATAAIVWLVQLDVKSVGRKTLQYSFG